MAAHNQMTRHQMTQHQLNQMTGIRPTPTGVMCPCPVSCAPSRVASNCLFGLDG